MTALRDELIQVAAVAVAWLEQIDSGSMGVTSKLPKAYSHGYTGEWVTTYTDEILQDIVAERFAQDEKWGSERTVHPNVCLAVLAEEVGEVARELPWANEGMDELETWQQGAGFFVQVKHHLQEAEHNARKALPA